MLSLYLNLAFRLGIKTSLLLRKYLKYYLSCLETTLLDSNIVANAYPLPAHAFQHPLGRPVRLVGWPDSGFYPTGCRGDSVTLRSPGNTPLGQTDGLVAQTRWDNPPGHVPGVRFATHEPAAVIQTVIHAPLFCTFSGVRIWQKSGETQW